MNEIEGKVPFVKWTIYETFQTDGYPLVAILGLYDAETERMTAATESEMQKVFFMTDFNSGTLGPTIAYTSKRQTLWKKGRVPSHNCSAKIGSQ